MSDDFFSYAGRRPDPAKWEVHDPPRGVGVWDGRQPGLCAADNVWVQRWRPNNPMGLRIQSRAFFNGTDEFRRIFETRPQHRRKAPIERGYTTYTTGMVSSRKAVKYGYFEVEAKTMQTQLVNAFWFSSRIGHVWTEIDVFENSHVSREESKWNLDMRPRVVPNAHVYNKPTAHIDPEHLLTMRPREYEHSEPLAFKSHTYGLLWTRDQIVWFFDGKPFVSIRNEHWHQPMFVRFDVETNFAWHGITPNVKELHDNPKIFTVHYFRVFSINWFKDGTNWTPHKRDDTGVTIRDTLREQGAGRILSRRTYGKSISANKFDEFRAMSEAGKVRKCHSRTYNAHNLPAPDRIDPSVLIRAPYDGETFGREVRPPRGMTWLEAIRRYSKKIHVRVSVTGSGGLGRAVHGFLSWISSIF